MYLLAAPILRRYRIRNPSFRVHGCSQSGKLRPTRKRGGSGTSPVLLAVALSLVGFYAGQCLWAGNTAVRSANRSISSALRRHERVQSPVIPRPFPVAGYWISTSISIPNTDQTTPRITPNFLAPSFCASRTRLLPRNTCRRPRVSRSPATHRHAPPHHRRASPISRPPYHRLPALEQAVREVGT
jgi:hypothetical protein